MSIDWNPALNNLINLLAGLYTEPDEAKLIVRKVNLDPARINFSGPSLVMWMRIVEEANKHLKIPDLIDIAKKDYPHIGFDVLDQQFKLSASFKSPKFDDATWKGSASLSTNLEQVIGEQPTFLPISFLETGLLRAKSVVRVENSNGVGTGFLTHNNLLITNNHVIPDPEIAEESVIWFNYQKSPTGVDLRVEEFALDPDDIFATSPMDDGDDWTAVRIKGNPNKNWGALDLSNVSVPVNGFVNIIQHPSGTHKQIALYHNMVVYVDDSRVQYLTDTMPGSSGSPVFDSKWRVVALHHAGGWLVEPGGKKPYFRNEGIHVKRLIHGLKHSGIL